MDLEASYSKKNKKQSHMTVFFTMCVYIYNLLYLVAFCEIERQYRFRVNTAKNGGSFKKFKIKPGMFGWHFFQIIFYLNYLILASYPCISLLKSLLNSI